MTIQEVSRIALICAEVMECTVTIDIVEGTDGYAFEFSVPETVIGFCVYLKMQAERGTLSYTKVPDTGKVLVTILA